MDDTFVEITASLYTNIFCLKVNINNMRSRHETKIEYDRINMDNLLFWWMLKSLKPLFFEMPLEKIDFTCSKDAYERFGNMINHCDAIIKRTNNEISRYSNLRGVAKENEKILFFNIDDNNRYKNLYERLYAVGLKDIVYLNMDSGFNRKTRESEDRDIPMPLNDLIDIAVKKGVNKILSINHYVLEMYLFKVGVYLIPLFKYLGVEYVIFDNDPWDLQPHGYLTKAFFNVNSFNRFTCSSFLNKYWDNKYESNNIHYIAPPQGHEEDGKIRKISKEYDVIVLSNSRLENVKQMIRPIIYLFDHMKEDSVFTEAYLWYMSLRYMILNIMKCDEFELLHYNSMLHRFAYTIEQVLKYEVIESLDTARRIEIYGDIGWEILFPEYYKKLLNTKEMDGLFAEKNHLYLLLNHNLCYVQAGASVSDVIKKKAPFITMAPLVKTPSFEGFRHIEFRNKEELNYLIENIQMAVDNEELKESMRIYRKILKDSGNEVEEKVLQDRNVSADRRMFGRERKKHEVLLDQMIEEYIDRNEAFLRESFGVLILGKPVQHDISRSRYLNRKYVQQIFHLIEGEKRASA